MTKRTRSSSRWLAEHESDPYVRQAREQGWRSRAVFKLEEIQRSDRLIRPGMTILDTGVSYAAAAIDKAAKRLVIVADPGYHAIGIYRSLGFVDWETQVQLTRPPGSTGT